MQIFLVQVHSLLVQSMVVPIGAFLLKLIWNRPHGSARMDFNRKGGPQKTSRWSKAGDHHRSRRDTTVVQQRNRPRPVIGLTEMPTT
jgi:hypothetical protein